jgi:hypothetical protein
MMTDLAAPPIGQFMGRFRLVPEIRRPGSPGVERVLDRQNNPFEHMQHYAAADRGIVMLNNWDAHYPGLPVHFRYDADPYRFFNPADLDDMDLAAFEAETGHAIDAILVLTATPSQLERDHGTLFATLNRLYCPRAIPASIGTLFVHHAADGRCPP